MERAGACAGRNGRGARPRRHRRDGARLLLDGPHEAAPAVSEVRGRVLVSAGIGITPALSVIRSAADRGERRPILLLYGSRSWDTVTCREELTALESRLPNLRIVHTLSRPQVERLVGAAELDAGTVVARRARPS